MVRDFRLDLLDDGCSRDGALKVAEALIAAPSRPAVVIGHPCARAAVTAAPVYQKAGVLFVAAGVRHPDLTRPRAGPLVFRAAGRDDRQGHDAGRRLRALAGKSGTCTVIHDRTVMARTMAVAAQKAATGSDGVAPQVLTIVASENDYTDLVDRIVAAQPHAVLFLGFPAEAAIVLRQLRQRGRNQPFLVNDAMAGQEFIDHADQLLDAHVEVMMPVSISRDARPERELPAARTASDVAAAVTLWRDATTATNSVDGARIAAHLARSNVHLEEIGFDYAGDARVPSYAPYRRHGTVWRRADFD